jgi:hypothetical protein
MADLPDLPAVELTGNPAADRADAALPRPGQSGLA